MNLPINCCFILVRILVISLKCSFMFCQCSPWLVSFLRNLQPNIFVFEAVQSHFPFIRKFWL
uniref:Uncharacterized protein n=1 Tax=Octopus bimaculoides TaxID=37653 RepID=A0A0L8FPU5_OCTBM